MKKNLWFALKWRMYDLFSEKRALEFIMTEYLGYDVDLDKPKTFNEKLNWMKLNNRNPQYTIMADKYSVKKFVADRIGEEYVVPCLGVWDRFEMIDFEKLPNQFVLKATHQSGVIVCKDKSNFDMGGAKKRFTEDLKRNYYKAHHEWVYKDIKPRIIADKYLDDGTGAQLRDYKWWCFGGEPKAMYLTIKSEEVYENFYDMDFNPMPINHGFPRHIPEFEKPQTFDIMRELAAKLSKDIPFVRIDFYEVNGHVYFGECTFYDWGAAYPFATYEQDLELGSWIKLPSAE